MYIGSFTVQPTDAIQVTYLPNLSSPTFQPWSYQPEEFSSLTCWNPYLPNATVPFLAWDVVFSGSPQDVILQDSGILNLQISPVVFATNPTDPIWQNFEYGVAYFNYTASVNLPISVMSELDANQQLITQQEQNQQYAFNKLQAQLVQGQTTETVRGTSITLFLLGFASFDIAITLYGYSKREDKKREHEQREATRSQRKILEWVKQEPN
jgi:hypothetical protein